MIRPFETDYSGAWRGHCVTRESAIMAGMRHLVEGQHSRCTVTNRATGEVVARMRLSEDRKRAVVQTMEEFKR